MSEHGRHRKQFTQGRGCLLSVCLCRGAVGDRKTTWESGGTDQWAHKPYLGPAVVLTGAMVTVGSSRRNINPAYVHLSLKSPLSRVHKVVAPLGW